MKKIIGKILVTTVVMFVFEAEMHAQSIYIHADERIEKNIFKRKVLSEKETDFFGYRVQIYQGKDRAEAQKIKQHLLEKYPQYEIYMTYNQPFFRVRLGDFRNKTEALKPLHDLKQEYEGAFIAPDRIKFPRL